MIVEFKNLASVEQTKLALKPLTVIIGPNNSNKTYIAYAVYGLLDQFYKYRGSDDHRHYRIRRHKDGSIRLKVGEGLKNAMWDFSFHSGYFFSRRLDAFYQDSTHSIFKGSESRLHISLADISAALRKMQGKQGPLTISLRGDVLVMRTEGSKPTNPKAFFRYVLPVLLRHLYPKPYVLPAERTGLILVYRRLLAQSYGLLRETQRALFADQETNGERLASLRERGNIALSEPLEQFLDFLTEIELGPPRNDIRQDPNPFQDLADQIEITIQNSNRTVLQPTKLSQEIRVTIGDDLKIDLHNASSSIKQLASFLLYLRYRAAENQLLIIDEPEINLHPESQVKLLEVFGILVNLGVRVLITTHSPYFMAHLNNLISGITGDPEILTEQASSLYLGDHRAFLPKSMVSAYEMKDYKLNSLMDEEYGVRWDSLSDVSADVQQKYFEIYEKGKAAANGKKKQKP